ncbi:TPA: Cro/Cl family transcriptional regulator [Enterobacter hormaechei subsp. hoffmannii]|uniref:Gp39 n=3 Tax=root TaxID=1 RepID=Q77WN8_BPN15|nr:Cro/CI family transcriptional regulator [Enterobacter hormaechei]NP_046934.1 transcriptional regulator [Escherichia phage N15]2HIN_A Chain A, Repressor protein [Escherichia phage N15]2HIN_B Chain B, Repressor protein [Escherichia phage N15]6ON0_A Chain A, Gp39 [Ravinvirus N15]6ON0_B Chain B, Gp39 [Ravinvirus N15]EMB2809580.1 Cro/Cl family transcriptional regulator [Enterobacter hormaechei subsp. hoffmannii]AAB81657.1 repressor protein [Escherichia phage N15]AAC19071.1 gp39 [Escherichia p
MKPEELVRHFGDVEKAAVGVGVTPGAVYQWLQAGEIPPLRQSDIEVRTAYKLKSDFTSQRMGKEGHNSGTK